MEARIVRDGTPQPEAIHVDELRARLASLADGEWIWVDGIEPTEVELTGLREQLVQRIIRVPDQVELAGAPATRSPLSPVVTA